MKNLYYKIKNSDLLSQAEVLRLKVTVVLIFLFIFGFLTVPTSIFENLSINIIIFVPLSFLLLYVLTLLFLIANKVRLAMHLSIYNFIGLTVYYVGGSSELYGYLVIFITLTIIIFYQDIYTYLIYGGIITLYGIYYLSLSMDVMSGAGTINSNVSLAIYQFGLAGFYITFLVHFILAESFYESLNKENLASEKYIQRYTKLILSLGTEVEDNQNEVYNDIHLEKALKNISKFVYSFWEGDNSKIEEVVEFYQFLHTQDIDSIKKGSALTGKTKQYIQELEKYLLYENNHLAYLYFKLVSNKQLNESFQISKYYDNISIAFTSQSNRIFALGIAYMFFSQEYTQLDKWGRFKDRLTHEEITELFKSKGFRKFMNFEEINFYLNNIDLFERYLR